MYFVGNLIPNMHRIFFDDDVIVTSSVDRTQSICVLFFPHAVRYGTTSTATLPYLMFIDDVTVTSS